MSAAQALQRKFETESAAYQTIQKGKMMTRLKDFIQQSTQIIQDFEVDHPSTNGIRKSAAKWMRMRDQNGFQEPALLTCW